MEWNGARMKFSVLSGQAATAANGSPNAANATTPLFAPKSFWNSASSGSRSRPLAVVALLAMGVLVAILLRSLECPLFASWSSAAFHELAQEKSDPVSERAQALNSEIAALEAEIKNSTTSWRVERSIRDCVPPLCRTGRPLLTRRRPTRHSAPLARPQRAGVRANQSGADHHAE